MSDTLNGYLQSTAEENTTRYLSNLGVEKSDSIIQHETSYLDKKDKLISDKTSPSGRMILPKLGPRPEGHYEKAKIKLCQFPDCNRYYEGTGFSKYCKELYQLNDDGTKALDENGKPIIIWEGHRHRKFRKEIDATKKKIIKENPNQVYHHKADKPQDITFNCDLCANPFTIKVYQQVEIYPIFCESHRSEFRRYHYRKANNLPIPVPLETIDPRPEPAEPEMVVIEDVEEEIDGIREILTISDDSCAEETMAFSFEHNKCELKECLGWLEGNKCDHNLPTSKGKCTPNSTSCALYETDLKEEAKKVKACGGFTAYTNQIMHTEKPSTDTIPSSKSDDPVKVTVIVGEYTIRRHKSHSYVILDSDGNQQPAKPILISLIMESEPGVHKKEDLMKRGTRPLGNTLLRIKCVKL